MDREQRIKEYNEFLVDAEYIHYETEADKYRGKPYEDGVYKEYNENSYVLNQRYDTSTPEGLNKILSLSSMRINDMLEKGYQPQHTSQEETLKLLARHRARNYIRKRILENVEDVKLSFKELSEKYDKNTKEGLHCIVSACGNLKLKEAVENNHIEEYIEETIKNYKKPE